MEMEFLAQEEAPLQVPLRIDIASAFAKEPAPLDFVLPGMLAGTVGALVSPGGAGKSMMALQLATLIASGADLIGFGTKYSTGNVVILAAEDPPIALQHRLHALGTKLNPDQRIEVSRRIDIFPLQGYRFDLEAEGWEQWVLQRAKGTRLLIVDTLRRIHQLDENDSGAMALLVGKLESIALQTGCAILFLHHTSKSSATQGQGDIQQASRGSSVLVDNIRWQSYLAAMTRDEAAKSGIQEEQRGYYVRWGVSKQNYGSPIPERWLKRHERGVLLSTELPSVPSFKRKSSPATTPRKSDEPFTR